MSPPTREQYEEIRRIVDSYTNALIAAMSGSEALTPDIMKQVRALDIPSWEGQPFVQGMRDLGLMVAAVTDPGSDPEDMTYDEYRERLRRRPTPLTSAESFARDHASRRAGEYVRGLGSRIAQFVTSQVSDAHAEWMRDEIREAVTEGRKWRQTAQQVASEIGHATGDWSRDLLRIAATEGNNSYQEGIGAHYKEQHGDAVLVARVPAPDACPDCVRLFLTAGQGSPPVVFELSEIESASNVGKRRSSWVPTLESVHPWCQCATVHVPPGMAFDEDGDLVPV